MNSSWRSEILAVLAKEAKTELRSKTGIYTGGVFSLATIVTVSLALYNKNANSKDLAEVCASLIWIILLFASLITLPRTFVLEEEQGTMDMLRLLARPHAVYWGKVLLNLAQIWLLCAGVSILFLVLTHLRVPLPAIFVVTLFGGGASLATVVTLCGAIASHGQNRSTLAATISIPLVLGACQWGVTGFRSALGVELVGNGWSAAFGLVAYAILNLAIGPWIYASIWKS